MKAFVVVAALALAGLSGSPAFAQSYNPEYGLGNVVFPPWAQEDALRRRAWYGAVPHAASPPRYKKRAVHRRK